MGSLSDIDNLWPPSSPTMRRQRDSTRPEQSRRQTTLTRNEIVQAAIALADAGGEGAVNMRHIAKELDVSTMSLYWHVADKQQLLEFMLDALEGEIEPIAEGGDWRTKLTQIALQKRQSLLRHPWVVSFFDERPAFGPNSLLQIERALAALDDFDLGTTLKLGILMTLDTYLTGSALNELREIRVEKAQIEATQTNSAYQATMERWMELLDQSGRFVRVLRILQDGVDADAAETRDERFQFGLDCVLDGIEARIPRVTRNL